MHQRNTKISSITAVDLLDMESIENVNFVQADIEIFGLNLPKKEMF